MPGTRLRVSYPVWLTVLRACGIVLLALVLPIRQAAVFIHLAADHQELVQHSGIESPDDRHHHHNHGHHHGHGHDDHGESHHDKAHDEPFEAEGGHSTDGHSLSDHMLEEGKALRPAAECQSGVLDTAIYAVAPFATLPAGELFRRYPPAWPELEPGPPSGDPPSLRAPPVSS